MDFPTVSIIIPVYNVAEFLPRCIDSVLHLTYVDFELILVDDGSTDASGQICDAYANQDSRVVVFHVPNGGAGAARKLGVQHARGSWIMFVDGDDTIPSDSLQRLYDIAKGNQYDMVVGSLNLNNTGMFKHKISGVVNQEDYICALLLGYTSVGPVAKLYKAELYKSLEWNTPKEIKNNEDLLMLISLSTNIKQVYVADQIIAYNYLYREGSASKSKPMALDFWLLLFGYIESLLHEYLNNQQIFSALFKYELRLLYLCNILQGSFVNPDSKILVRLRAAKRFVTLDNAEQMQWKILNSPIRQRAAYARNLFVTRLKNFVKRCMGRR